MTKCNTQRRWINRLLSGLVALTTLGGCKQQLFMEPADYKSTMKAGLEQLESRPHDPIPPSLLPNSANPATVVDPSRPSRMMSLKECIAIALEQGNVGTQGGLNNPGFVQDQPFNFAGRSIAGTDTIRALVVDPAIVGADIERALSKFDARLISSLTWSKNDQAVVNFQQAFNNGDTASLTTTLAKPLPTGGVAGVTVGTDYRKFTGDATRFGALALTTQYTPRVQFLFEQPLLQNFGVEVNQLAPTHPGSLLVQGLRPSGGQTTEGILITRIRYEQQRAEFDRQINNLLLNVEYAYWNLYAAYYNLYAQEDTLKQSFDLYTNLRDREAAGTINRQDLTQTIAQYWQLREQALTARSQVLSSERQLRGLMGMNSFSDGLRIVPADEPTLAPYLPDFMEQANEGLANRPELILARHDLKFRQLDIILQKNQRRADLRAFGSYDITGIGSQLDGSAFFTDPNLGPNAVPLPANALASLGSNRFNSWQFGLRLDMPLGFRDANAAVRQSQLNLTRSWFQLQDGERKVLEIVVDQYRQVIYRQQQIDLFRQRRVYLQETLSLNNTLREEGTFNVNTLFNILQVQRDVAAAIAQEFQAVALYNSSIAGLEFAKGTIQRYNNCSVGEGPLPGHVSKRAAEHFSARNAAIKVRERPAQLPLQTLTQPWQPLPGEGQTLLQPEGVHTLLPSVSLPNTTVVPNSTTLPAPKSAPPTNPMPPPATGQTTGTTRPWPMAPVQGLPAMTTSEAPAFVADGTVQLPARRTFVGSAPANGTPITTPTQPISVAPQR